MKMKYVYWQDDAFWLGYLSDYPDYMTQGETLEELRNNLKDLYKDFASDTTPCIRKVDELEIA